MNQVIYFRPEFRNRRRLIQAIVTLLLLVWLRSTSTFGGQRQPRAPIPAAPITTQLLVSPSTPAQETGEPLYRPALECAELFETRTIEYTGRGYTNEKFEYGLFVPLLEKDKHYPLIVWLHGYKEGGQPDNPFACLRIVDEHILPPPWERSMYPYFVLTLQCPPNNRYWTTSDSSLDDMTNVMAAAIENVVSAHTRWIDVDRIYLSGVSTGGAGCWELAQRQPKLFAAVAPLATSGYISDGNNELAAIPIWAFHTTQDPIAPPGLVKRKVEMMMMKGGQVSLTLIDSHEHDCWTDAFTHYDLLPWLLAQNRKYPSSLKPGQLSWSGHFRSTLATLADSCARGIATIKSYSPTQWLGQITILMVVSYMTFLACKKLFAARLRRTRRQ